jgi:glycine/D-amino acid oxidase-like deaminating enzyme
VWKCIRPKVYLLYVLSVGHGKPALRFDEQSKGSSFLVAVDVLIVGGGLAGCAMAWQCRARGLRALLIDQPRKDSSSRVAAGLVTPITGSRFAVSWRWQEFFPVADTLYRHVEQETHASFWSLAPAWRVFTCQEEREFCHRRWFSRGDSGSPFGIHLDRLDPLQDAQVPEHLREQGGVRMEPAGRLDVPVYLHATRTLMQRDGCLLTMDLDVDRDLDPHVTEVAIPSLGMSSRWVVLCQGYRARTNRWFADLPLHPARGDILHVRSHSWVLDHVLHHDGWIVPLTRQEYLLGASYDRQSLDTSGLDAATKRWREELSHRWTTVTGEGFGSGGAEVLEQRIAIRPASYDRHPLIGPHPRWSRVWCLNGLGSKGSLMAPWLARHLLNAMTGDGSLDSSVLWSRREPVR